MTKAELHQQAAAQIEEQTARERLLSAAVDSSDDAIILQKLDGTIIAWNRAAEQLFEYPAEDAMGRTTEFIAPPERHDELYGILEKLRKGEPIKHFETVRVSRAGRRIDVSLSISPVRLPDGTLIGSAKIARDVTARKAEDERFRLAIEASPDGMLMTDAMGIIQLINAETERLFGYDRDELVGQQIDMLLPERARAAHAGSRAAFIADPSARRMGAGRDLFARRKDGTEFPVEVGLNPFKTRDGLMVLAALIDITERKKAEDAIAAFTEDLKRSNAELEEFAYIAAHDLQEPLRMVASYTELLASRYAGQLDERADKYIHYAVDGAKRMKGLINDLLTYSRVGSQGKPLGAVDTERVLQLVIQQMKVLIGEASAQVVFDDALPPVMADDVQLGQLFQNLIGNAIKFRSDDAPHITITASRQGALWEFAVADNGIGMAPEHAGRIFQMFQRLHERGRYEGSGIGLAVSKKIVERHGGRIWFESELGKGTTFHFTLKAVPGGSA